MIPFIGITIRRANGKPLHAVVEQAAQVRLVQTTTIPGQKGRVVQVQVESESCLGSQLLFEPEHQRLRELGIWAQESLITVQPSGKALIPIQNFQGMSVKLKEGEQIGVASLCDLPGPDEPEFKPGPTLGLPPQTECNHACTCSHACTCNVACTCNHACTCDHVCTRAQCNHVGASVKALPNTPERYAELMKVLDCLTM